MGINVAVVGATGLVGQKVLEVLAQRRFPVGRVLPLASSRSAESTVRLGDQELRVELARPEAFAGMDVAFFAATGSLSRDLAPEAAARGCVAIDKSSTWRLHAAVPLVVPEVNPISERPASGIVSCPNCTTIPLVMALKALMAHATLERVVVTSFQSVSGTGRDAVDELAAQLASPEAPAQIYRDPIAHNVLPYCETFTAGGYTTEELKLRDESRKILGLPDLAVTMTCCRVPVWVGHSLSVLVELDRELPEALAREALGSFPGVRLVDEPAQWEVPTPRDVEGKDEVLVGRVRRDLTNPRALWLWIVGDNLRKGAATNAVQIAEGIFKLRQG